MMHLYLIHCQYMKSKNNQVYVSQIASCYRRQNENCIVESCRKETENNFNKITVIYSL